MLTTKAKYITMEHVAKKTVWIGRFFNKLELEVIKTITLHNNNKINIALI